jgi:adenine-specific DNA-methyltransferase
VALALARTRLMAARFPYYLLTDSPEGRAKESELTGVAADTSPTTGDVRKGFVYRRVPHITLKSIAQNPDIREGMTREEIDAAIAHHADTELLRDQPYEDRRRVRVTGPFTVESLSPHRVLVSDEDLPASQAAADQEPQAPQYEQMVLDNLRKAGVQNTVKQERLVFTSLEVFAGRWLQAAGEYLDADGNTKRVAVSIGPEHGTVGPEQVKEAAKEATRGVGFGVLVVCGFSFDARTGEVAKEFTPPAGDFAVAEDTRVYGRLPVLLARMNPDLAMSDDLLKTTGAGNLFMVFGEPDLDIRSEPDGLVVEVRGVDVYDPTSGQVRSNSTDDIACWFIDTDYNGESFFVRHAYFTGADEPYQRLQRALRADIDESAWSSLYSTVSRPFPTPTSGRIAVKVINHYGDEVLKVYDTDDHPAVP